MNDVIAEKTIEDHKYLLELVENRCAISYFAAVNRNQSLYFALKKYHTEMKQKEEEDLAAGVLPKKRSAVEQTLEASFDKMIQEYDFMSIIMYPELQNRREFVHDSWYIAKTTENDELKVAILKDPYFYLTREDILTLLKTHDNRMITLIMENESKLLIQDDDSYELVLIKRTQVDKNQMTIIKLIDFVSVLVANKREDEHDMDSTINFSHNYILDFLKTHQQWVNPAEIIRIFIMGRRFRLSLQFIQEYDVPFQIEYFTNAMESNAYEIAFFLLKTYEDQIHLQYQKALDAHVKSYKIDNRFLKSKLHMSKMLLGVFSFNSAK
jgi:hypothetical protein